MADLRRAGMDVPMGAPDPADRFGHRDALTAGQPAPGYQV
jgi:hypothetical protein